MDLEFKTKEELYNRLLPALRLKKNEMFRDGINYVDELDIWNYLCEVKWKNADNLLLYEMVDHIINSDNYVIDGYLKQKFQKLNRTKYFD